MRSIVALCAVVVTAALAAGSGGAATRCMPTPSFGGGPDRGGTTGLRAKIGTGHVLTGVVLTPACTPVAGAFVSFWQSNANGVYTAKGRGLVKTTKAGRFRFEGPMPTGYNGREAHIHILVQADGYEPLFTEYEPHGTKHGNVRLVLTPANL